MFKCTEIFHVNRKREILPFKIAENKALAAYATPKEIFWQGSWWPTSGTAKVPMATENPSLPTGHVLDLLTPKYTCFLSLVISK